MTTVAETSGAVRRLPKRDLAKFRRWFVEYDAAAWDRQFEHDVADGRLDKLAREALKDQCSSVFSVAKPNRVIRAIRG